jgi:hypothetical protein
MGRWRFQGRVPRPTSAMDDTQNPAPPNTACLTTEQVDALIAAQLAPVLKRLRKVEHRESHTEREHRLVSAEARAARIKEWERRKKKQRDRARKRRATPGNQDAARRNKVLRALKLEVLTHYSLNCVLGCSCDGCHATALEQLTLDHLSGLGHLHRNAQGRRYTGATLYKILKDAGYPSGYATACGNCNFSKRCKPSKERTACPLSGQPH